MKDWKLDSEGLSQISEDKLNWDAPASVTTKGPAKKKKSAMAPGQNARQATAPAKLPMSLASPSINNYGSGTIESRDVGNIEDSTISNVGNNNSKNYYQPRPYATQNLDGRRKTFPAQSPGLPRLASPSITNQGPGRVVSNDVGNIKNSTISNVGNNNSQNFYPPGSWPKRTNTGERG